jgi:hypothetical protein
MAERHLSNSNVSDMHLSRFLQNSLVHAVGIIGLLGKVFRYPRCILGLRPCHDNDLLACGVCILRRVTRSILN